MNSCRAGNPEDMATVAELERCDGFAVEGPGGYLGTVEETWLDEAGRPGAVAVRTPDGQRGLLLAGSVLAVDLDAEEVLVGAGADLRLLEAPRITAATGTIAATWRATDAHLLPPPATRPAPHQPARGVWRTIVIAFGTIATLVAVEIGLAMGIADLVTGRPY